MTRSMLILTLALSCSTSALAQVSTPPGTPTNTITPTTIPNFTIHHKEWEGTFYAGYAFLKDYKFQTAVAGKDGESPGVVEMEYKSGYRIGARATQNFSEYFSATVEYGFSNHPLRLVNVLPRIPVLNMNHNVHSFIYDVSFSPLPLESRFRPHIEIGTGALLFHIAKDSRTEASDRDLRVKDSWEMVFNYGIGFKYLVADSYALVVDVKGRTSNIPTYGLPKTTRLVDGAFQPAISSHGPMNALQLTFGFAHQWDSSW